MRATFMAGAPRWVYRTWPTVDGTSRMVKPMYVGYAEFSHPSWLSSACQHETTGRRIAADYRPCPSGVYRWRRRSNPTEGTGSRRQVSHPFFYVVQLRTALVVTPTGQAAGARQ